MRTFLIITGMFFVILSPCIGIGPATEYPPILIDIHTANTSFVYITEKEMSLDDAKQWLQETINKFGTDLPVIIRLQSNQDILFAAKIAEISIKICPKVFIGIIDPNKQDHSLLLIPISPEPATFTIPQITESTTKHNILIPSLPYETLPDPASKQLKTIDKINKGQIP